MCLVKTYRRRKTHAIAIVITCLERRQTVLMESSLPTTDGVENVLPATALACWTAVDEDVSVTPVLLCQLLAAVFGWNSTFVLHV